MLYAQDGATRNMNEWLVGLLVYGFKNYYSKTCLKRNLKGQNIFPLKPGFRLIKVYYESNKTWKYFRLR
jgi:hypothetical protein